MFTNIKSLSNMPDPTIILYSLFILTFLFIYFFYRQLIVWFNNNNKGMLVKYSLPLSQTLTHAESIHLLYTFVSCYKDIGELKILCYKLSLIEYLTCSLYLLIFIGTNRIYWYEKCWIRNNERATLVSGPDDCSSQYIIYIQIYIYIASNARLDRAVTRVLWPRCV